MASIINSNTDIALINTSINAGTITLPACISNQGRVITFKDTIGIFGTNTLTLQCSGSDTFEDGGTQKVLRESYGSIQLVASDSKWYILNGTQVNTLQVSTLNVIAISTINLSTVNSQISSLSFFDNRNSTNTLFGTISSVSTQAVSTNFLYYNNYIIAGTRVGYSNILNNYRFSVYQIPFFNMWLDSADSSTLILNGSLVAQWNDKSFNSNFVSQSSAVLQPTYSAPGITFNLTRNFNTKLLSSIVQETVIGVVQFTDILTSCNILAGGFLSRQIYIVSNSIRLAVSSRTNLIILDITSIGTNMFLFSVVYNYNSSLGSIFVNGGSLSSSATASAIATNPIIGTGFSQIGGINGTIYELFQYNNSLSTIQRQQVEGYLAWKWNLQNNLPASHPYKNAPP